MRSPWRDFFQFFSTYMFYGEALNSHGNNGLKNEIPSSFTTHLSPASRFAWNRDKVSCKGSGWTNLKKLAFAGKIFLIFKCIPTYPCYEVEKQHCPKKKKLLTWQQSWCLEQQSQNWIKKHSPRPDLFIAGFARQGDLESQRLFVCFGKTGRRTKGGPQCYPVGKLVLSGSCTWITTVGRSLPPGGRLSLHSLLDKYTFTALPDHPFCRPLWHDLEKPCFPETPRSEGISCSLWNPDA